MKAKSKTYKDIYKKLKLKILLKTLIITFITGILSTVIVYFLGLNFKDKIRNLFIKIVSLFNIDKMQAINRYDETISIIKYLIVIVIVLIVSFIFLYKSLSSVTKYIDNVIESVDLVLDNKKDEIVLMKELKPLEDKINNLKNSLIKREIDQKKEEEKKSNLLLYLAHDIKTPLTTIITHLQLLKTNYNISDTDRIKYINIAYEKSIRLNSLLQEFFDIARYSLKEIELTKEKFNLSLMLEQISDELFNVLSRKNLRLELKTDEELIVYGDINRIARVFDNLLKNAVAYSDPNSQILITAREVGIWIEVTFTNKGKEIPKKDLEMIFENFYRGDNSRSSKTGGSGLGLAISKKIVELHDGKIEAYSENNSTTFVVVLPEVTEEERKEKNIRQQKKIENAIAQEKIIVDRS